MEFRNEKSIKTDSEWNVLGHPIERIEEVNIDQLHEYLLEYTLTLNIARNHPYFTLTMAFPIMLIACLAPLGMLLPIDSGEKMGYQVTLFLTLVVYLELVSQSVPIPEDTTSVPKLVIFFIIIIFLLCLCILCK